MLTTNLSPPWLPATSGEFLSEACNLSTLDVVRYRQIIVSAKGIETIIARANLRRLNQKSAMILPIKFFSIPSH